MTMNDVLGLFCGVFLTMGVIGSIAKWKYRRKHGGLARRAAANPYKAARKFGKSDAA